MEEHINVLRAEVPQSRGVARDALLDAVFSNAGVAFGAKALTAFANAKAQPVATSKVVVVACATGDISVAGQYLVIEQKLADLGLFRINRREVIVSKRPWQVGCEDRNGEAKGENMKQASHCVILAGALALASPVHAEIETARDLMEAGQFTEAMQEFLPMARSGNADAEELIGVMYALGLGVEKDPERAFEWYLRASMKGHPGAQSGLGWYYELGIGIPEPDLVRAYLWYGLSTIGGDPDAAISLEEVQKKMTSEEIDRAEVLINDYKPWMYPFR